MLKKIALSLVLCLAVVSCATKKEVTTAEAKKQLEETFTPKIGTATKQDLISEFGNPEWCKLEDAGNETCRFYRKKGTKWIGDEGRDKKNISKYDEIMVDLDSNGILKAFKARALR